MDAIAKGCVDTSGSGAHSRASSSGKKVKSNSSIVLALSAEEWQREAELCTLVNTRYPKNYYGWLHRLWLLSTVPPLGVDTYRGEVQYATDWLRKNVSDHCGVNYLEQSVQRLRAALSPADQGGLISLDVYGDALYKMKDRVERAGCRETCVRRSRLCLPRFGHDDRRTHPSARRATGRRMCAHASGGEIRRSLRWMAPHLVRLVTSVSRHQYR